MEPIVEFNNKMILEATKDFNAPSRKLENLKAIKKWERFGVLKGGRIDKNPVLKENLAVLFENQARALKKTLLTEANAVGDIGGFNRIVFPLVRRVFASLLANNIVSVQPMSQPSGLVFFLDFVYDRTKAGHAAGDSLYGNRATVTDPRRQGIGQALGTGGLYGYDGLGYASREFLLTSLNTAPVYSGVTGFSSGITGVLSGFTYNFLQTGANIVDMLSSYSIYPCSYADLVFDDSPNAASGTFRGYSPLKTTSTAFQTNVDRTLARVVSSSSITVFSNTDLRVSSSTTAVLVGRLNTYLTDASNSSGALTQTAEFEQSYDLPKITAKILQTFVSVATKKLAIDWTPEMAQDLNAYMSLDAEVELTNVISEEIAAELDREIIGDLINIATVKGAWSRRLGRYVYVDSDGVTIRDANSVGSTFTYQAFFGTQRDWNDTLGNVASAVSNKIFKLNLRRGATWMITSMQIASIMEGMKDDYAANVGSPEDLTYSFGTKNSGTFKGEWDVYKDPLFPENLILMGFKGTSQLEAGYIWCPYIPLLVTPTVLYPNNFTPTKGVMTRNGKTAIRPEFYGTITVLDLGNFISFGGGS
jgi:hypothetical protein